MRWLAVACLWAGAPLAADTGVRFEDVSNALPVWHIYSGGWEHFVGGGVSVFDCNNDHLPEIVAAGGAGPTRLMINESGAGGLAFALGSDFDDLRGVTGAYPVDIDSDGWLDLILLRVGPDVLLRGAANCQFTPAPADWGFDGGEGWSTAFSATFEAGAAWPTLAIGQYVDLDDPLGPFEACDTNRLLRPDGNGFGSAEALEPGYCALSMLFSDWQRTGQADLRVSNDRHYYVSGGSEQMWRLGPEPLLLGADDGFAPLSIWGMGIASRDLTGEGRPEVFLTSMGDQILQYDTGASGLTNAPFETGATAHRPFTGGDGRPSTGWHAQFADVDNDTRADIFIAKGNVDQMPGSAVTDPNNLLMQTADGTFLEAAGEAGIATMDRSRGGALADFDGDGRLDLVVVNRRAPMELYRNVTPRVGNWLSLDLRRGAPNTRAIGAVVEVQVGDGPVQAIEVTLGGGHGGDVAGPLHFGLGRAEAARVRVLWPGGRASDWTAITANQRFVVWPGEGGALRLEALP